MDLRLTFAVPKILWDYNPHCPYDYQAMVHLYLFKDKANMDEKGYIRVILLK